MLLESEAALEACCCCFHASLLPATHVLPYVCTLSSQDTPSWAGCSDATYEAERYKQEGRIMGRLVTCSAVFKCLAEGTAASPLQSHVATMSPPSLGVQGSFPE